MRSNSLLVAVLSLVALAVAGCRFGGAPASGSAHAPAGPGGEAAAWVAALRSDDFDARNRAAERLIAMGEAALPALAAAGEGQVPVHGRLLVSTTRPVVGEILARAPVDRLARVHLVATAPVVRTAAAEELGRREGWGGVPFLIERLGDEDPGVRGAASASLRRLTNQFFGFEARASVPEREAAAERWRSWWYREGRLTAAEATHRRE